MSYILDALKKAQADESADSRTALALELKDRSRQRRWQSLLLAALLLNAGVFAYLFGPWSESPTPTATTASGPDARAPEGAPATAPAPTATALTAARPVAAPADAGTQAQPAATTSSAGVPAASRQPPSAVPEPQAQAKPQAAAALERISFAALPAAARARFPDLDFSTHLYASDAELRAVVMNGQRLQEGERYGELELEEITESGVVLRFERYLVSVPVLDDWQ